MPTPETLRNFRILGVVVMLGGLLLMHEWCRVSPEGIAIVVAGFIVWLGAKLVGRRHRG